MSFRPTSSNCPCTPATAAGCDRLAMVLATGMRIAPAPPPATDVAFTFPPDLKTCPICLESMIDVVSRDKPFIILECGHALHVDCMNEQVKLRLEACPLCRTTYSEKDKEDMLAHALRKEVAGDGEFFEIKRGNRLLQRQDVDGNTKFYEGDAGKERLVRVEFKQRGMTEFYKGEKDQERLRRTSYYDVENGTGRLMREVDAAGNTKLYEGVAGKEYLVSIELKQLGITKFYKGEKGQERLVTMVTNDRTNFYDEEGHLVRANRGDWVEFYGGEPRKEYIVKIEWEDRTGFYDGERGKERLKKMVWADRTGFYDGERGEEKLVKVVWGNSKVGFYKGGPGEEHIVKINGKKLSG